MPAATIGRYNIINEISRSNMGVVYKGHDPTLERMVIIKILSSQLLSNPEVKERFIKEVQSAARLNYPNILGIFDINEQDGIYYIVF